MGKILGFISCCLCKEFREEFREMDVQKEDVFIMCNGGVMSRNCHSVNWFVMNQMSEIGGGDYEKKYAQKLHKSLNLTD